jgi:hypothetical protein
LLASTIEAAVRDGAPMVIVGGGDGSLSCTVDEVVDNECVFALLPLGTANSFARHARDLRSTSTARSRRSRPAVGAESTSARSTATISRNCAAMGLSPMIR